MVGRFLVAVFAAPVLGALAFCLGFTLIPVFVVAFGPMTKEVAVGYAVLVGLGGWGLGALVGVFAKSGGSAWRTTMLLCKDFCYLLPLTVMVGGVTAFFKAHDYMAVMAFLGLGGHFFTGFAVVVGVSAVAAFLLGAVFEGLAGSEANPAS